LAEESVRLRIGVSTRAPLFLTASGWVDADEPGPDSISDLDNAGFNMSGDRENTTKLGTDTFSTRFRKESFFTTDFINEDTTQCG
jgi:hypothetical protein